MDPHSHSTQSPVIGTLIVAAFIVAMFIAPRASAQSSYYDEVPRVFTGGVILGANFATIDDDEDSRYDKLGANMGAVVFTRIKPRFDISMEMLFSQKGQKDNQLRPSGIPGVNFTYTYDRLNYIEVPVMLNYIDQFDNRFGAGFSYGRLVSATEIINTDSYITVQSGLYPFNKEDYEFIAGTEFHIWQRFYLTFRFQYSMVKIRTELPSNNVPNEQNNNLFVLRLMYLLNKPNAPSLLHLL